MAEIVIMLVQGGTTSAIHAARLLHDLYTELWGGMAPDALEVEATACSLLEEGAIYGMIAYDGEVPVGVIMMAPRAATYANGKFAEITELYVAPAYRSRGLGARFLDQAKKNTSFRRWTRLEVGMLNRNPNLFLREGFTETGPRLECLLPGSPT